MSRSLGFSDNLSTLTTSSRGPFRCASPGTLYTTDMLQSTYYSYILPILLCLHGCQCVRGGFVFFIDNLLRPFTPTRDGDCREGLTRLRVVDSAPLIVFSRTHDHPAPTIGLQDKSAHLEFAAPVSQILRASSPRTSRNRARQARAGARRKRGAPSTAPSDARGMAASPARSCR